jgi:hypothetical protein
MLVKPTLLFLAAAILTGCMTEDHFIRFDGDVYGFREVADTVVLTGEEVMQRYEAVEPVTPKSTIAPDAYSWSTSDSSVARLLSPGRIVFLSPGVALITVKSSGASGSLRYTVCAAGSVLRITPHDTTITVGQSFASLASVGPPGGASCYPLPGGLARVASPGVPATVIAPGQYYQGVNPGTDRFYTTSLLGKRHLADTMTIRVVPP